MLFADDQDRLCWRNIESRAIIKVAFRLENVPRALL
jgi:hypothetical protein